MHRSGKRLIPALVVGACAAVLALSAAADPVQSGQAPQPVSDGPLAPDKVATSTVAPPPPTTARAMTRADVAAWLDGLMPYALQRGDIAGAVVVVVRDGQVLVQKGYGYADVAKRTPVDPARTLFRPGSVSKLFTWTAVMQLVEQGKLDLDRDVNAYLDFQIPPRDGQPITLRDLMTHRPGMEDTLKCLISDSPACTVSLGESVKRWVPTRIYAAGSTPAYSNYGTALAGYIVERVSGETFDDYIDRHIFAPLGMRHATFRQPLPARLRPLMAKGYPRASVPPGPFEHVAMAPAGALSASGADMGRFMLAHLDDGGALLKPATARQMHTPVPAQLPPLNRMALGFYQSDVNGRRVIAHGGDTQYFHSDLNLFLDDDVGLFVSLNSSGDGDVTRAIRSTLLEQFADRYLPGPPLPAAKVDAATAKQHAALIAGRYENTRRTQTSPFSVLGLAGEVKVGANEDGTITVAALTGIDGQPLKWREIAPFVWREVGGEQRLAARVVDGRVTRFSVDQLSPFMAFEPVPWWRSGGWLLPLLGLGLFALFATAVAWPVSALVRRHYGVRYALTGREAKAHRWMRIAALAVLVVAIAWGATLGTMLSNFSLLSPSLDPWLWTLRIAALVVFFGAAAIALWHAAIVLRSARRWPAKLWSVVLAVGCLAVLWVALAYRLIAFHGGY